MYVEGAGDDNGESRTESHGLWKAIDRASVVGRVMVLNGVIDGGKKRVRVS